MARALDVLPLARLGVSADVREHVGLLRWQAARAAMLVDPRERQLRDRLLGLVSGDVGINSCYHLPDKEEADGSKGAMVLVGIMEAIGFTTPSGYEDEMSKLEKEATKQAGTGGVVVVSKIRNLIGLLHLAKTRMFDQHSDARYCSSSKQMISSRTEQHICAWRDPESGATRAFSSTSSSSTCCSRSTSTASTMITIPDDFRCPISLDLMQDPVIVASGHTYDRNSIARWIDSGNHTCPKSGEKLLHMALIPNYALKSLIHLWCQTHDISDAGSCSASSNDRDRDEPKLDDDRKHYYYCSTATTSALQPVDHISVTREATDAVRKAAEFLVGKIAMGSPETQRLASYELRLLTKSGTDNRRTMAQIGAVPFLVTLLRSKDPHTQENAVTALLNLSIFGENKSLIMEARALPGIVDVLNAQGNSSANTTSEARENAATALFSLSLLDEHKIVIGSHPGAIQGLVNLLRDSAAATGRRDAATALINLASYGPNRDLMAIAGAVSATAAMLRNEGAGIADDALELLAALCRCRKGARELSTEKHRWIASTLGEVLRLGSEKGKETAVALLLVLCRIRESGGGTGEGITTRNVRALMNPNAVEALRLLSRCGSTRTKRKAETLLKVFDVACSDVSSQLPGSRGSPSRLQ